MDEFATKLHLGVYTILGTLRYRVILVTQNVLTRKGLQTEVDVDEFGGLAVDENVLHMSVPQSEHVPD